MNKMAPHPFSLRQMQYVIALADTLNFHKAAGLCLVSQPSLSAQLNQLEDVLGLRIFERSKRHVRLTQAGQAVLDYARRMVVTADDLQRSAKQLADPYAGTVRLGVIPTISPYLLPHLMPALGPAFPRLRTQWVEDKTEVLLRQLADDSIDAALLATTANDSALEQVVIAQDRFVLAAPIGHPLAKKGAPISPSALRDENVLLLDDGHCMREQALMFCAKARAKELEFRATSLATLTQMVASGAGLTLLPALSLATEARSAKLGIREFVRPGPYRTLMLTWRKQSSLAPVLQEMAALIRKVYPKREGAQTAKSTTKGK